MADNNRVPGCSGDCTKCNPMQRAYCAAQMSFLALERVNALEAKIDKLLAGSDGSVFNPMQPEEPTTEE